MTKLPATPKAFYLRPREKVPPGDEPWYINVPVGINTLQKMLPNMSDQAGTSVRYTNHSLRATSASRLFANNIPENVIQERTGHHSLAGLRAYERTTKDQERTAAKVLSSALEDVKSEECKDDMEDEKAKKTVSTVFSGQLENCVFNFYCK